MRYMRIEQKKFWAWVIVSLILGLGIGLGIMAVASSGTAARIAALEASAGGTGADASATVAAAEASIAILTEQNVQLASDLAAAQAQIDAPSGGSTASTAAISVVSRTVSPSSVATGGALTLTVKVSGHPDTVTMRIYTSSKSYDKTFTLKRLSTSETSETWRSATKAPTKTGTYRYYATAILGSTRVTMPGASPKSFTVH